MLPNGRAFVLCILSTLTYFSYTLAISDQNFVPKANADLTFDLMKILRSGKNEVNTVFSPSSLMMGVAMLYQGMGDKSRKIMQQSMDFPDTAKFNRDYQVQTLTISLLG